MYSKVVATSVPTSTLPRRPCHVASVCCFCCIKFCALFSTAAATKTTSTTITWHTVFFLPLNFPGRGTWPNFTADQATATACSPAPTPRPCPSSTSSSSSSLSATSLRHHYYRCALSQFLLSLRFSYNLQSCPANFDPDLHTHAAAAVAADVGICFWLQPPPLSLSPISLFWPLASLCLLLCVPCYLQRAWAVNLLPQCLLCSTLGGHHGVYVIIGWPTEIST